MRYAIICRLKTMQLVHWYLSGDDPSWITKQLSVHVLRYCYIHSDTENEDAGEACMVPVVDNLS